MNQARQWPSRPGARLLKAAEADAWRDGFALLEAARGEAERMRGELAQVREEARQAGFQAGEEEGRQQAARQLLETQADINRYLAALEPALADLALAIARQVLTELAPDVSLARRTRQALSAFSREQALTLWVPQDRVAGLREALDEVSAQRLRVEGSADLSGDEARLVSPAGQVDLGLDSQLALIRQALLPPAEPAP
jgi:type III secretion protein L